MPFVARRQEGEVGQPLLNLRLASRFQSCGYLKSDSGRAFANTHLG